MDIFPKYVLEIMKALISRGYEAYAVGGCVRDYVMGRTPHDYDLATNAVPEQIKAVFDGYTTVSLGERHGTVGVVSKGHTVEITTYRCDGEYRDFRRPKTVSFSKRLEDDLKRRDFTMNAMAMNINGNIIDTFGGRADIKRGIIRAVGDPERRICEDALRIMRCIRFASRLGFKTEGRLCYAVTEHRELLKNISLERIREEFTGLLCGSSAEEVLRTYRDIIAVFIPEIVPCFGFSQMTKYHRFDVWEHIIHAVGRVKSTTILRTAAFFHDIAKPDCFTLDENGVGHFKTHAQKSAEKARMIMKRLRYPSKDTAHACTLIENHRCSFRNDADIKRMMNRIGLEHFLELIELKKADDSSKGYYDEESMESLKKAAERAVKIAGSGECCTISGLSVNGRDMQDIGFEGRAIGEILDDILEKVITNKLENKRDVLIKYAKLTK